MLAQEQISAIRGRFEKIKTFFLNNNRMPKGVDYLKNKELPSHNWILNQYGSMKNLEEAMLK